MASLYHLKVVTPERTLFNGPVSFLLVRSTEGEIGILAQHMNLVTPLVPHVAQVTNEDGNVDTLAIGGGFLQVSRDETVVLADSAERPQEIDRDRAERARQRAAERLEQGGTDMDIARAKRALQRAQARLSSLSVLR